MSLSWEESYVGQIRALAGDDRVLMAMGARCVVRDDAGRVLLIRRADNGAWAMPAGTMELGETIRDCAVREVREETGLEVTELTPFGIHSRLGHHGPNIYGHTYQYVTLLCRIDAYTGSLARETDETTDAVFVAAGELPPGIAPSVARTLAALADFEATGRFALD
jgi:ADP-ribose pyrophosphatase YjhB (NUDIX family)